MGEAVGEGNAGCRTEETKVVRVGAAPPRMCCVEDEAIECTEWAAGRGTGVIRRAERAEHSDWHGTAPEQ